MFRGYLTRKRCRLAALGMLKDSTSSSVDSFEEELELEGDNKSKQDFIIHAYDFHPEAINVLKNIHDGSMSDISLPWKMSEKVKVEYAADGNSNDYNNDELYIPYENDFELDIFDSREPSLDVIVQISPLKKQMDWFKFTEEFTP